MHNYLGWDNNLLTNDLRIKLSCNYFCLQTHCYICFYFQEYFEHGETEDVVVSSEKKQFCNTGILGS